MKGEVQSTHWDQCFKVHHDCALVRIRELEDENSGLKKTIREYASVARQASVLLVEMKGDLASMATPPHLNPKFSEMIHDNVEALKGKALITRSGERDE